MRRAEVQNSDMSKPRYCEVCKKRYKNLSTFKQHLRGKRHQRREKELEEKQKMKEMEEEIGQELFTKEKKDEFEYVRTVDDITACLFTGRKYSTFEEYILRFLTSLEIWKIWEKNSGFLSRRKNVVLIKKV